MSDNIFMGLYDALGKPSFISAGAAILSGFAMNYIHKNRDRNDFVDKLMQKNIVDANEIASLKEVIEAKMQGIEKRLDDLIQLTKKD